MCEGDGGGREDGGFLKSILRCCIIVNFSFSLNMIFPLATSFKDVVYLKHLNLVLLQRSVLLLTNVDNYVQNVKIVFIPRAKHTAGHIGIL